MGAPLLRHAERILLIDDDVVTLPTLCQALVQEGFEAQPASTGSEGLHIAQTVHVDAIIADLELPDISGLALLNQLRAAHFDVPFAIVTDSSDPSSAMEAGRLGAFEYVLKPISTERLLKLTRALLASRRSSFVIAPAHGDTAGRSRAFQSVRLIEARSSEAGFDIRALAMTVGVSPEHISRTLKKHTGETFRQILRECRVRRACHLLETTQLTMKEIAYQAGFSSPSHFDRAFRKVAGHAPTQYRRRENSAPTRRISQFGTNGPHEFDNHLLARKVK